MHTSIFKKYFMLISAVILVSTMCIGAVLLLISSKYFVSNKKDALLQKFNVIAEETMSFYQGNNISEDQLAEKYKFYADEIKGDIFFINSNGRTERSSKAFGIRDKLNLTDFTLSNIKEKPTYYYSTLENYYDHDRHIIAVKIICNGEWNYLFLTSPDTDKAIFVTDVMNVFVISAIIVMAVVFVILYAGTINIVKPLVNMTEAAKSYAKGDFSKKVYVKENSEIADLANCLNEMACSLSKIENGRKSFVENVSHELRTPITSISGFVDGILDGTIPKSDEKKYLTIVSQESKRLSRMIYSMLNLAKIEAGEIPIKQSNFNMLDLIFKCLLTFEKKIDEKHINIEGLDREKFNVYADIDLIHQVVYNLIENAIKFIDENGTLSFSLKTKDNMHFISVRNTGKGISESEMSLVFDRFYKADKSRSLDTTGVGLGLYISSTIINMHDGNIMVKSIEGEYTEFTFSIPINKNNGKGKKN